MMHRLLQRLVDRNVALIVRKAGGLKPGTGQPCRMLARAAVAGILLATLGSAGVQAAGPPASTTAIVGQIVDGTKGSKLPSGLTVELDGVGAGHQFLPTQTTAADPQGRFRFDLPATPGVTYAVSTTYATVTYSATVPKAAGGAPGPVTLTIYEPTTSDSALRLDDVNWLFQGFNLQDSQIQVLETLTVNNTGDHTYVGDHRGDPGSDTPGVLPRTLRLILPAGASGFTPELGLDPSSLLPVAGGYVDTAPVLPGPHQVAYTFRIAYADGAAAIQEAEPYPVSRLHFLIPDVGLQLSSDHLKAAGTVQLQGQSYVMLAADQLPANQAATVEVFGLPSTPVNRLDPTAIEIFGIAFAALAVGLALYLGLRRPPESVPLDLGEGPGGNGAVPDPVQALADLDRRFEAGEIDPEAYRHERARRKQLLLDQLVVTSVPGDGNGTGA
jgi:hypothetical protein